MLNVDTLKTDGKVYTTYPRELRLAMGEAMLRWQAFCELSVEIKKGFEYTPDQAQSGNGYEFKIEAGVTKDRKENLHFRLSGYEQELEKARAVAPEAIALVESLRVLPGLITVPLREFAEGIEHAFGVSGFVQDVEASVPNLIIRLLHYFGDVESGDVIAAPHIDKGGFTFHLWESDIGVEQLSFDRTTWTPVPVAHDQAVIFPASGLQCALKNEVRALCHRVVATPHSARTGRYSAVAFIDFRGNPHYNKKKYGRLQDWPAGFNYDMPLGDFQRLFV